ncbi:hypothetical protein L596_028851 [Steinernema carpocapsae]|nr:hypothetical protein L596_028851 [Steinernema carpocapsae]
MSTQIRLRRAQDKRFQRTSSPSEADLVPLKSTAAPDETHPAPAHGGDADDAAAGIDAKNMCYFCQKCKNHGLLMWKKDHKRKCQYANCTCDQCDLIESRRRLDQHIKNNRKERKGYSETSDTPPAQVDLNNNASVLKEEDAPIDPVSLVESPPAVHTVPTVSPPSPPKVSEDCRESAFMLYTQLKAKASLSPPVLLPQAPAPPAFSFLPYFLTTIPHHQPVITMQPCLTTTDLSNWIQVQQRIGNFEMAL